jgi:hypothetical protein
VAVTLTSSGVVRIYVDASHNPLETSAPARARALEDAGLVALVEDEELDDERAASGARRAPGAF